MGATLKTYLLRYLRELSQASAAELLSRRYGKFRAMGVFEDGVAGGATDGLNGAAQP